MFRPGESGVRDSKFSIQLVQLNSDYGKQVYVPYSVGVLRSYSEQYEEIRNQFEFRPFICRRDSIGAIVEQIGVVDILGISGYVWNWRLSTAVAEGVRRRNPSCLILAGGPHAPERQDDFFDQYPFINIVCHGEGEITFSEILKTYLSNRRYDKILGLSYRDQITGETTRNPRQPRIGDLDSIPSPYLSGIFQNLDDDVQWMAIWETNRGCPFSCTFCDWGSAIAAKVHRFSMDRLCKEIDWFGKNKIEWVFGADANFGILKRDKEIVEALVRAKGETGYPRVFRVCFTKNSDEKVFNIARVLHDSNMSKGVSISMQSLNPKVLENVKRSNIKIEAFQELQSRYIEEGIATYTELIIGLPGESYESFVGGLDTLLDNGQHNQITIYNCTIMPNAEMGDQEYQKKHQIKIVEIPIFQAHSIPHNMVVELESIVISTATMSVDDWRRTYRFGWAVQCFHLLGLTQSLMVFLRNTYDIKYSVFYKAIIQYGHDNPNSVIGQEVAILNDVLDNVLAGIGFDQYMPQFSDVTWPPEEASFLRFLEHLDTLYGEIAELLNNLLMAHSIKIDELLLRELLLYQKVILANYDRDGDVVLDSGFNFYEYVRGFMVGKPIALEKGHFMYRVIDDRMFAGDKKRFAREVVWYGRKGGKYLCPLKKWNR